MKAGNDTVLIDVNEDNVSETGFFCYMSKRKSQGYRRKLDWLKLRFAEGMKIKMLGQGQRGFIEYIPGEYAWRSVNANGFMMIHCLWVVGKSKGKRYGSLLLNSCLKEAKKLGMKGVAAVTSQGNWLIGKSILINHGFESFGQAPPSFELMVKPFGKGRLPSFTDDWDKKAKKYGRGLTIVWSDQCPYLADATRIEDYQCAPEYEPLDSRRGRRGRTGRNGQSGRGGSGISAAGNVGAHNGNAPGGVSIHSGPPRLSRRTCRPRGP